MTQASLEKQGQQDEYLIKEDSSDWLTLRVLGSLAITAFTMENLRTGSCSVHKAGCPSSPNLMLEAWSVYGEPLVLLEDEECWPLMAVKGNSG